MFNKVILGGRTTADVTMNRITGRDGNPVVFAKTGVANDRPYKDNTGNKITDFYNIEASGKTAEFMEKYLKKGARATFTCHLKPDSYDKTVGGEVVKIPVMRIVVEEVDLYDWPEQNQTAQAPEQQAVPQYQAPVAPTAPQPQYQAPVTQQPQYQAPVAPVAPVAPQQPQYQAPQPQYQAPVAPVAPQYQAPQGYAPLSDIPGQLPFN